MFEIMNLKKFYPVLKGEKEKKLYEWTYFPIGEKNFVKNGVGEHSLR